MWLKTVIKFFSSKFCLIYLEKDFFFLNQFSDTCKNRNVLVYLRWNQSL